MLSKDQTLTSLNRTVLENNKRIAKNTLLLYFRMILSMLVSLFTVRVVLNTLGNVDYGINNVVGGIVLMFSFLGGTMASASQRFFAYELGRKNFKQLKKSLSLTISIYFGISIIVLLLAETAGWWFLNTHMTIPEDRIVAANWVYQFSVFSFIMTIITIPYNAIIIAHEDMGIYSYVSIAEVTLKLIVVYLLTIITFDKLILYSLMVFVVTCLITFTYRLICRIKYKECRFQLIWDKVLFKEIMSYSGWNMFGAVAGMFKNQGINILLNIFFNPVINAARGIAFHISSVINQFVMNFFKAVQPQITKYYANGNNIEMLKLVFRSSKLSYFLLFFMSMPVLLETNYIFTIWLKDFPGYTVYFTRLVIITALIESLSYPLMTAAQATGKIKIYQAVVGSVLMLTLPVSWLFLMMNYPPESTMYVTIAIAILCLFLRLWLLRGMVGLSFRQYADEVVLKIIMTTIFSYITPFLVIITLQEGLFRFFLTLLTSATSSSIVIFVIGLKKNEQQFIMKMIRINSIFKFRYLFKPTE